MWSKDTRRSRERPPAQAEDDDNIAFVVDASALLAYLRGEPGGEVLERVFRQCLDCGSKVTVSAHELLTVYSEVVKKDPAALEDIITLLHQLPLEVAALTHECAVETARVLAVRPEFPPNQAITAHLSAITGATLLTCDGVFETGEKTLNIAKKGLP